MCFGATYWSSGIATSKNGTGLLLFVELFGKNEWSEDDWSLRHGVKQICLLLLVWSRVLMVVAKLNCLYFKGYYIHLFLRCITLTIGIKAIPNFGNPFGIVRFKML